ncbi:c-type cytochrome [Pseudoroseicyclus tamaricis]|uniref:C-type cytochrome n=1 Tax=Pseudoroseicyclus tamaricis TaxID=2705421 RepID=A0A6B2K2H4_9RHOB|nr:c-type cytochrome [Pseudoroseicyclus tamaricis]NDV02764.1 c-type cytochrome [Pseudoroseicyclus tamaricis]
MKPFILAGITALAAAPVFAQDEMMGDAENGETLFSRQCVACHVVVDDEGETIAGRNARTGPNLYAINSRPVGSDEDFRYSDYLPILGEDGSSWTEEWFVEYVQDPTGFLRAHLDDSSARSKMAFQVRHEEDAYDIWAFLTSVSPEVEDEGMADDGASDEEMTEGEDAAESDG